MSPDEGPLHVTGSDDPVAQAVLGQLSAALDRAVKFARLLPPLAQEELLQRLRDAIRDLVNVTTLSSDGESGVNRSDAPNVDHHDPATTVTLSDAPIVLPRQGELSNRNHLSKYLDDTVLFLLLRAEKAQQPVYFDAIRRELERTTTRLRLKTIEDGAIRTRLSRLRSSGLIAAPETAEKGSPSASRRKVGVYSLTTDGHEEASRALRERTRGARGR
jgi:DNA-binding PadR family transcriptional regulator